MDRVQLLQAVAAGRVTRAGATYAAAYLCDGRPVERMRLAWLKRAGWLDMPLSGAPVITEDGQKWLSENS